MQIRHYQPGDEEAQASLYNIAARNLPGFKPAKPEEIARRYQNSEPDAQHKFYAIEDGKMVGYVVFNANGRISFPWCLPEAAAVREPLLRAALGLMKERGFREAWAAYRADWAEPISFLEEHGFKRKRDVVNYVATIDTLPYNSSLGGVGIAPLTAADVRELPENWPMLFAESDTGRLETFLLKNEYFQPKSAFALRNSFDGSLLGIAVAIIDWKYADPTKLDAAMPCFRLGAIGTETERHKRVNGMFSGLFHSMEAGETLLAEAIRRFRESNIEYVAAQAPSDIDLLMRFYKLYFKRQGAFPILTRQL